MSAIDKVAAEKAEDRKEMAKAILMLVAFVAVNVIAAYAAYWVIQNGNESHHLILGIAMGFSLGRLGKGKGK